MGRKAAVNNSPRPRRAKGSGGLVRRTVGQGKAARTEWRGTRTIDGKRYWTKWWASELLAESALKDLTADKAPEPIVRTLSSCIDAWMRELILSPSSRGGYEQKARVYVGALRDRDVSTITRDDVSRHYRAMMLEQDLSISTIRQTGVLIRGGLGHAHDNGWLNQNVAIGIRLPPAKRMTVDELPLEVRAAILESLCGHRYEARYRLALLYGLRPGETTGLVWDGVDFAAGTVRVRYQLQRSKVNVDGVPLGTIMRLQGKSAPATRTIWPDKETMQSLQRWRDEQAEEAADRVPTPYVVDRLAAQEARLARAKKMGLLGIDELYTTVAGHDLVFTLRNGEPILPRRDADEWKSILQAVGASHQRLYSTRHTAINWQLLSGVPLEVVSIGAGHGSLAITERSYGGDRAARAQPIADYLFPPAAPDEDDLLPEIFPE